MKIAYVTTYDSSNVRHWSGLGSYILRALQDAGLKTESIGSLSEGYVGRPLSVLKKLYYSKLWNQTFLRDREPKILDNYAVQVKKRLASIESDVVFSPGSIAVAHLQTEKPVVFWTDATFAGMVNFYPEFAGLCSETIRHGHRAEQLALSKCRLAIYASEWAADTAIENYEVDPEKVKIVPFGANIDGNRDSKDIEKLIAAKSFDTCKLLFVGVDWHRKGGDKALEIATLLNKRGLKTELHVVGCAPPLSAPSFMKSYGFISKATEEGRNKLNRLFSDAHFFILPSRAECFGVVFAEASSFALPSLATRVGGIPSAVRDGKNGWTFELDATAAAYCDYIEKAMESRDDYRVLALSCFQEYSTRINWHSAGRKVFDLLHEYCC